ncbi:MAG: septum formation protein Maf [Nitrospirae bacterium GWD2_57_9]|nr:MAG: septum formation protein Maf [Nitrospirae bacterium GWD2_57_9]
MDSPIILASSSPRRREMLKQIGLRFTVDPADVDERVLPGEEPEAYAVRVAQDKARIAAGRVDRGIIIAADTIVVLDNKILGKPLDEADAERMLSLLSGRQHRVMTGLVLMNASTEKILADVVTTFVRFKPLAVHEIRAYALSGEPLDKAGAYGIQEKGALLVDGIEGDYFNVVGLPLCRLGQMLAELGVNLF